MKGMKPTSLCNIIPKGLRHFFPVVVVAQLPSLVRLFVTPWTAAYQAPPFMGFSRQEYWSGVPLPSPDISLRAVDSLRLECCNVGVLRVYMMFHILHNVVKDT